MNCDNTARFLQRGWSRGSASLLALMAVTSFPGWSESSPDIARQIAEIMRQSPNGRAGQRFVHAKGIVCQGTFEASPEAASVSRAAHFRG